MHGWCENFSWYSTVKNVARFLVLLSKRKICLGKSREISNKLISKIQDICKTIFYKLAFAKEPCLLLIHFAYNWKEFFRTNCANDKKSLPFGWYYIKMKHELVSKGSLNFKVWNRTLTNFYISITFNMSCRKYIVKQWTLK